MGFMDSEVNFLVCFLIKKKRLFSFRVEELNENIQDRIDVFGNVLVQTVDLARAHYFLKYASLAQVNILLSGTTGSCKSFLLDTFLSGLGLYKSEK
jgi:Flp pilus assembly CpaF family ATPase